MSASPPSPHAASSGARVASANLGGEPPKKKQKTKAAPDPKMLKMLSGNASKSAKNRHTKQDSALNNLSENGTLQQRQEFADFFNGNPDQIKANSEAITKNVRLGGLNELLRTADTPKAAVRSMGMELDVRPTQSARSGKKVNWFDYQRATSGPTENFIFKNTSPSKHGAGVIQDSHINGLMKVDGHPSVGETSWSYHNASDHESLASNFGGAKHVKSLASRNCKMHKKLLVTAPGDILSTPATGRAAQTFRTKKGRTLRFDDPTDLKLIARIAAVRGQKELTRQFEFIKNLIPAESESESEPDEPDHFVPPDADSEDEAERLYGDQ